MQRSGITGYFANNSVAANLLMIFIIIMGLVSWNNIKRQLFSTSEIAKISINVKWPGAGPEEVEEGITVKIEESLKNIPEITKVISGSGEGSAVFILEVKKDVSVDSVVQDIQRKLDAIPTFPVNMEPLIIDRFHWHQPVMRLVLTGPLSPLVFKKLGSEIRTELLQLDNVHVVDFLTLPENEVAIEIDPLMLRKFGITLEFIANQIVRFSQNVSAGKIRTKGSELFIRHEGQAYSAEEFGNIPIIVGESGQRVVLSDIANISDTFAEGIRYSQFNSKPATSLEIYATEKDSMPLVAESLKLYVADKSAKLPAGVELVMLDDTTTYLDQRIDMMLKNLVQGAVLVFLVLAIFLRFRVAGWVMLGLPVVLLGTVMLMYTFGILINVTTLFAFIMVLGIVVDDAVVIAESAYKESSEKGHSVESIVAGVKRVSTPVTFGILTTIAVFMPMLFADGNDSGQFIDLAAVVIICLLFSLLESRLILPSHLAHTQLDPLPANHWRQKVDSGLMRFIENRYLPMLRRCINAKALTMSLFLGALIISVSMLTSQVIKPVHLPKVAADTPKISVVMNNLVTEEQTQHIMREIENIVWETNKSAEVLTGQNVVANILTYVSRRGRGELLVELVGENARSIDAFELSRLWYGRMSVIPGVYSIKIQDEAIANTEGGAIGYRFFGNDFEQLSNAALELVEKVSELEGVYNVTSTINPAVKKLTFDLKPIAYSMGLTPVIVAQQINAGFHGFEAQRMNRDGRDIRVMVRYPDNVRSQRSALRETLIFTPAGHEVRLGDIAVINEDVAMRSIRREDGFRSVLVLADVDTTITTATQVTGHISDNILPSILSKHKTVKTSLAGSFKERAAQQSQMMQFSIVALILVFTLLAIPLKSYVQPLLVLSVVPFGIIGAVWGHLLFGYNFSLFSLFGVIAAIGVMINDSLVLVCAINTLTEQGFKRIDAVFAAVKTRFRPILLTSVTTFVGLIPIMFESSLQGQYVAPMAISLAFALLISTFASLILVPLLYMSLGDKNKEAHNTNSEESKEFVV
ncbi:Multidrug efflux pump subunit AcrB [Rheinheimera pacifica]|uniref:Multidrug efflux pump subunit AcrB n=1 Tax=Rheinheimera pacifica TaxID=173990 RepID=A0A1H6N636_9GAMM|nr:efflux RND transporter permease subunit [Rheinheimera pacifica]SEI05641.1 Multidrug efflux pump subunit AcrB [Rheinheimera pacifica]